MDEELPGFKINDYSGDGDDVAENGSDKMAEEAVGEAATIGAATENSHVTHGEGEIKPVMLENESMGGSEETAPKTALKTAQKSRKGLVIGVVAGVLVLAAIGVGAWLMLGQGKQNAGTPEGPGVSQEGEEKPEEKPNDSDAVELGLDDEIVQGLWGDFEHATSPWDDGIYFYKEAISGGLSRQQIINAAFYNLSARRYEASLGTTDETNYCVGTHLLQAGEDEFWPVTGCFSGEEMRKEIKRLFGFDDYAFADGDVAAPACEHLYDVENDEFWPSTFGCGGSIPARVLHQLYKAEKSDDKIYLYETATFADMTGRCGTPACGLSETGWDVPIEGVTEEIWNYHESIRDYPGAERLFNELKWIFRRDGENYVFESLEKVK